MATREEIIASFELCNSCNVSCKDCAFQGKCDEDFLDDEESCVNRLNRAVYELLMNLLEENEALKDREN